jgi:hypothetical protein
MLIFRGGGVWQERFTNKNEKAIRLAGMALWY